MVTTVPVQLVLSAALAAPTSDASAAPQVQHASACARVFGDRAIAAANREQRLRRLYHARVEGPTVEIEFRGPWGRPRRFTYEAFDLATVRHDASGPAHAVLRVHGLERLGCPDGLYAVGVDDALGRDARVLAVLEPGIVLIEAHGRLGYLLGEGVATPVWRTSWDSGIRFRPALRISTATGSRPARVAPARPAAARPAKRTR